MIDLKHTPGPWVWTEKQRVLNSAHGKVIDHADYEGMWFARYDDAEDEANARLIAAAPDLLDALREAEAGLEFAGADKEPEGQFVPAPTMALRIVRAAIAKAEGREG